MKTTIIFTCALCLIFCTVGAQDFRNAKWGDSPEEVKKNEVLPTLKESYVKNKLESINYIEFTDKEVYHAYTYMFYENQLVGGKIKTGYLVKENSRFNILPLYDQMLASYKEKYKNLKEEKAVHPGLNKFFIVLKDRRIYVEMKEESGEYYILESIMRKKEAPGKKR